MKVTQFLKLGLVPVKQFVLGKVWPLIRMRKVYSFLIAIVSLPIWMNPFVWAVLTPIFIGALVYLSFKVLHSDKNPCEMERAFKGQPKRRKSDYADQSEDADAIDSRDTVRKYS